MPTTPTPEDNQKKAAVTIQRFFKLKQALKKKENLLETLKIAQNTHNSEEKQQLLSEINKLEALIRQGQQAAPSQPQNFSGSTTDPRTGKS